MRGAQAIGARVAASDNHDVLAGRKNLAGDAIAFANSILLGEKIHGKMDSLQLAPRHGEISSPFGATGEQDRVKFFSQILYRYALADMRIGTELNAFGRHLLDPA